MQAKLEVALLQHLDRFGIRARDIFSIHRLRRQRLPRTQIPHHDRSRAVIALGNGSFEIEIRNRMILDLHRQPLISRIKRRPLRNGPRLEHAFHLQPEIVVQTGGTMLLHHEAVPGFLLHFRWRLRRFLKAAFAFVLFQWHRDILLKL